MGLKIRITDGSTVVQEMEMKTDESFCYAFSSSDWFCVLDLAET